MGFFLTEPSEACPVASSSRRLMLYDQNQRPIYQWQSCMQLGMKQPEKIPYAGYDPSYILMYPVLAPVYLVRALLLPKGCYSFSLLPIRRWRAGKSKILIWANSPKKQCFQVFRYFLYFCFSPRHTVFLLPGKKGCPVFHYYKWHSVMLTQYLSYADN